MKSFLSFIQQINFGKALDSCKPNLEKYPSGGFVHNSRIECVPNNQLDPLRVQNDSTPVLGSSIFEITEKALINIGFHRLGYPELHYLLNEETSLVMVCAESKWYGAINQFSGLKPQMERVYISKHIKSMKDVQLLIQSLSE